MNSASPSKSPGADSRSGGSRSASLRPYTSRKLCSGSASMRATLRRDSRGDKVYSRRVLKTGGDHLERLRDGRELYLGGERIDDVTTHRAFRNGARSVAGLYDLTSG